MDGAKLVTDTVDHLKKCIVDRRSVRAEVFLRINMDLMEMRIPAVVRS
jgi:hypothetical protein